MDVEVALRAFASAGHDLPREAMRWALDNWDEAAPGLLGALERFVDGTDRSEEAANALFFILHLAGERRETRINTPEDELRHDVTDELAAYKLAQLPFPGVFGVLRSASAARPICAACAAVDGVDSVISSQ